MKSDTVRLYVIVTLILQVASTAALWVVNVLSVNSTAAYELLLAADLVAFAIVLQAYRNPDSISRASAPPPATAAPQPSATTAAPEVEVHAESKSAIGPALPPIVHIAVPILAALVLVLFALVLSEPANESALPATSTLIFVPIYLAIVVLLVFGSMYLFKRLMDTEPTPESH